MQLRGTHPELVGCSSNAQPFGSKPLGLGQVDLDAGSPTMDPPLLGGGHPSSCSFSDQLSLEFSHGGDDMKGEPPSWRRGVDPIMVAQEVDPSGSKLIEGHHEVTNRAGKPIEPPTQDDVMLALVAGRHEAIKLGTPIFGAADPLIDVLGGEDPTSLADQITKGIELEIHPLV